MNKGFEMIEAHHLFGSPTSGSTWSSTRSRSSIPRPPQRRASLAHLGYPDMRVPISYALHFPEAPTSTCRRSTSPLSAATSSRRTRRPSPACASPARPARRRDRSLRPQRRRRGRRGGLPRRRIPFTGDRSSSALELPTRRPPLRRALRRRRARRASGRGPDRGDRRGVSWVLASPASRAHRPPRVRPLHRGQARRDAGRALLPLLPAEARLGEDGETEYGIGAIPLGGFVKITGMNPEERAGRQIERAS